MKCTEDGCGGRVDVSCVVPLGIGHGKETPVFACIDCGKLHCANGREVILRNSKTENGHAVYKGQQGAIAAP